MFSPLRRVKYLLNLLPDFSIHSGINVLKCTHQVIMRFKHTPLSKKAIIILLVAKTYISEGKSFMEGGKGQQSEYNAARDT